MHLQHRPKPVVIDDPEDDEWVGTKENLRMFLSQASPQGVATFGNSDAIDTYGDSPYNCLGSGGML